MEQVTLALQDVRLRPEVTNYEFLQPANFDRDRSRAMMEAWEDYVKRDAELPVDDLFLGMTRFNPETLVKVDDVGQIHTTIDATDTWRVNCVLSHIPSHIRSVDKRMGVVSHFPQTGKLDLSFTLEVSDTRLAYLESRIEPALREETYLLLDCNLPYTSRDGHCLPKCWMWDVYGEVAKRLDPDHNTSDSSLYNPKTCIYCNDGKIVYGISGEGVYLGLDGTQYTRDDIQIYSTQLLDTYVTRTIDIVNQLYSEGYVHLLPEDVHLAQSLNLVPASQWLWRKEGDVVVYPSPVEIVYNQLDCMAECD